MSGVTPAVTGGVIAAVAAAKRAEMLRKEEEIMTNYNSDDLKDWEFKIVRANTEYFRKPDNLRKVIEEEAKSGWELVEKFDNNRVRFKRRIDERKNDQFRETDPYRTNVGVGAGALVVSILGIVFLAIGILFLIIFSAKGEIDIGMPIVIIATVALIAIALIIVAVNRKK
ncbi:MAG: hypothetical protein V3V99_05095 [candidate division Zixibacteria bacterium]